MKKMVMLLALVFCISGCGKSNEKTTVAQPGGSIAEQASVLLAAKKLQTAVATLEEGIKKDPNNVENYLLLSEIYIHAGQNDQASSVLKLAMTVSKNDPDVFFLMAWNYGFMKNFADAYKAAAVSAELYKQKGDQDKFRKAAILMKSFEGQLPGAPDAASVAPAAPTAPAGQ
ncbi:MAG: tetratricopeptide repeat protein [Candidatus Omnitrophica bacterium]|nr:tetratricopeptide repeat protein [Candidatus Omnitrophota bacterium]